MSKKPRFKLKKRRKGSSTLRYGSALNADGQNQLCVTAECQTSGKVSPPIWGHAEASMKRALATLNQECDCPATFHKATMFEGHRVTRD